MPSAPIQFDVCGFQRVFDTDPKRERVTLSELTRMLTRFEVKPAVRDRMERDVLRVDRALERVMAGKGGAGPAGARIRAEMRRAKNDGDDVDSAVAAEVERLREEARRAVKRDLRLWSPVHYPEGVSRGSDHVSYVSCLVLDYDDGTPIAAARATWAPWHHVVHTTWSHREGHPKFRVVLPLAGPVAAADWDAVWSWASRRTGDAVDPSGRSVGATFALPTVADEHWPRAAHVHEADLLDPVREGLVAGFASRAEAPAPAADPMHIGRTKYRYIDGVPLDNEDWAFGWDAFDSGLGGATEGAMLSPRRPSATLRTVSESPTPPPVATTQERSAVSRADAREAGVEVRVAGEEHDSQQASLAALRARIDALERENAALRTAGASGADAVADALERLAALRREGLLDDDEFRDAKARVIAGDD